MRSERPEWVSPHVEHETAAWAKAIVEHPTHDVNVPIPQCSPDACLATDEDEE